MQSDPKFQTFAPRLFALVLDTVLLLPLAIVGELITDGITDEGYIRSVAFGLNIASILYFVLMNARFGQTVGKMLMNVKILQLDETPIKLRHAVLRDLPQIVFAFAALVPALMAPVSTASDPPLTGVMVLMTIWGLADIAVFFSNSKRRALHDLIAGTIVVRIPKEDGI